MKKPFLILFLSFLLINVLMANNNNPSSSDNNSDKIPIVYFGSGGIVVGSKCQYEICPESCWLCKCAVVHVSISTLWNYVWDGDNWSPNANTNFPVTAELQEYNSDGTLGQKFSVTISGINTSVSPQFGANGEIETHSSNPIIYIE